MVATTAALSAYLDVEADCDDAYLDVEADGDDVYLDVVSDCDDAYLDVEADGDDVYLDVVSDCDDAYLDVVAGQGWNSQFCFWSQRIYNGGRICYFSYVFMVPY